MDSKEEKNMFFPMKCLHGHNGELEWFLDQGSTYSIKIEWDLTNGPLGKLLELLDTQV